MADIFDNDLRYILRDYGKVEVCEVSDSGDRIEVKISSFLNTISNVTEVIALVNDFQKMFYNGRYGTIKKAVADQGIFHLILG